MKRITSFVLALLLCSCATVTPPSQSDTSSGKTDYYAFLENRGIDTDGFIISKYSDTKAFGVDMSAFADDGYFISANSGEVVILAKTDDGLDRAVRNYAKYGNSDDYFTAYGEGYRVKSLTVCGNDISEYVIVTDSSVGESGDVLDASTELQKYIEKTCGVHIDIVTAEEYSALSEKPKHKIAISHNYPDLADEGFTIETTDFADVNILGGRYRGCLYGVYDLLRDMGWRFITDAKYNGNGSVEFLYEAECVNLTADINRTEMPAIAYRQCWCDTYITNVNHTSDKSFTNATGSRGYGLSPIACHGLENSHWLEDEGLYSSEGQIFNQPCYTSEEIVDCIVTNALKSVQSRLDAGQIIGREIVTVDVAQYDNQNFCSCENCRKAKKKYGATSGAVLEMTNTVADAVSEKYPGVYVSMLAYAGTNVPPVNIEVRDNVKIAYCVYVDGKYFTCSHHCIDGSWDGCDNEKFAKELRGWKEICSNRNLDVWYYPFNCYQGWVFQAPIFNNMYHDVRFLIDEIGVNGIMFHVNSENGVMLHALTAYLGTMLCWDSDITEDEYHALIREWFDITYGDAGYYLYEYFIQNEESAVGTPCWCSFFSKNYEKVNAEYYASHFDSWWDLFNEAKLWADTSHEEDMINLYEAGAMYMCLGITHTDRYVNATDQVRAEYVRRYGEIYRIFREYDIYVNYNFSDGDKAPDSFDASVNPFDWSVAY